MKRQQEVIEVFYSLLSTLDNHERFEPIKSTLSFTDNLADKFDLDSLDMIEFYLLIQDKFDVSINDSDFEKLLTVDDIVNHIECA